MGWLLPVFYVAHLTRPSQGSISPRCFYRATISGSVQVRTLGCVVASPKLYNSQVNQCVRGLNQCLREVPPDIIVKAHITRASGGVEPLSPKAAPRKGLA